MEFWHNLPKSPKFGVVSSGWDDFLPVEGIQTLGTGEAFFRHAMGNVAAPHPEPSPLNETGKSNFRISEISPPATTHLVLFYTTSVLIPMWRIGQNTGPGVGTGLLSLLYGDSRTCLCIVLHTELRCKIFSLIPAL